MQLLQVTGLSYPTVRHTLDPFEQGGLPAVFYLPSYSPELNPEERLIADPEQAMGKRVPVRTTARLRNAANEHMAMLEQSPGRVMGFFPDPGAKYPAG